MLLDFSFLDDSQKEKDHLSVFDLRIFNFNKLRSFKYMNFKLWNINHGSGINYFLVYTGGKSSKEAYLVEFVDFSIESLFPDFKSSRESFYSPDY